jgi:hypothetical protein
MRALPVAGTAFSVTLLLTACSSVSSAARPSAPPSLSAAASCAFKTESWLAGKGGTAFQAALDATSAVRSALASGDSARLAADAKTMSAAVRRAAGHLPPGCDDPRSGYRIGMTDWMGSAIAARDGKFNRTSSGIANGAHEIALVSVLKHTVQEITVPVTVKARVTTPPPATPPPTTAPAVPAAPAQTTAPAAPPPAAPAPAAPTETTAPAGCYPLTDGGNCYEPGEYCRDSDHGASGVAGDGEAITCADNDGWRWEPS